MAKNKISEWSATPANNTDVGGIDIAEGCAPSGINNAIREMMAQIKDMQAGTDGDNFTVGGNLVVSGTASGVTPGSSDDSTKFATTEWVQDKVGALGTLSTQDADNVSITGGSIANTTNSGSSTSAVNALGYLGLPQDAQSSGYTLVLADAGKHIYYTGSAATLTVPTNASVAFPTGSAITIINNGSGSLTIGTTSLTVYWAGTASTGNRTLATKGIATLIKVASDTWFISGVGLT
jgi:hypothetical protein